MNADVLEKVEAVGSRNEKERLLAQLDAQGQRLVKLALDPDVTFGVTVDEDEWIDKVARRTTLGCNTRFWDDLEHLLASLASRSLTGNAAADAIESLLLGANKGPDVKWACRIINTKLRAGFDIRTFNAVFGAGSVEKFTVQLAETYDPDKHDLRGSFFVQPKLDVNRVIGIDGEARSRNGKLYPAAQFVMDEIKKQDPGFFDRWVTDGEMMGDLGFDQSSGALRRITQDGRKKASFTYWAFDLISRDEWEARKSRPLVQRHDAIWAVLGNMTLKSTKIVPSMLFVNPTHAAVMLACENYLKDGFEGAMLKDISAPYKWGRGDNLLKVKKFYDADLQIVDFYEGKGKHKGQLGGIIVEGTALGKKVRSECGSGFDDPTRELVWQHRKDWLGAIAQVQFQEVTPKGSLRFPVFIMRRKDKE